MNLDKWWKEQEILITGGTGTLGSVLVKKLMNSDNPPKGIRIFSRDEQKQAKMKKQIGPSAMPISFLIGDVRDRQRLSLAMRGVSVVVNTAAMKHVDQCEYNPLEAVNTNVFGAENVIAAAISCTVERVMHVSTDKAVYPVNLYGATKAVAERLFIQANVYGAMKVPLFSCCRYGNVLGSKGSVAKIFRNQYERTGTVDITNPAMTRFWITIGRAADFILKSIEEMNGGEIFIPHMGSMSVVDLARAVTGSDLQTYKVTKQAPGEKVHEQLINNEESLLTEVLPDKYAIKSQLFHEPVEESLGFGLSSFNNPIKLDRESVRKMLEEDETRELLS